MANNLHLSRHLHPQCKTLHTDSPHCLFLCFEASPNNPYNLKLVSIYDCRQCVIISSLDRGNLDTYLVDKSSVLCTLTVQQIAMKSIGFRSDVDEIEQNNSDPTTNETKSKSPKSIHTLTTLSNSICHIHRLCIFVLFFFFLAVDSNVQYVEQGNGERERELHTHNGRFSFSQVTQTKLIVNFS